MRHVVICEPVRSPIGRYGGMFKSLTAVDLGVAVLNGLLERTGLDPAAIEDVILGHCNPNSEAPAIGRVVALDAALPVSVPGQQIDRRCGSGLQAVINAAMQVHTGAHGLVVAGGTESMSNASFHSLDLRWVAPCGVSVHDGLVRARTTAGGREHPLPGGMLETAENLRRDYAITRDEQDALAVESHRRAAAAQQSGASAEEIIPVTVRTREGDVVRDAYEPPRPGTSMDSLAKLKPILIGSDAAATMTVGNASGQNDAATMYIVTTPERAERLGLVPLVRLVPWAAAGVPPSHMGIGPVPATASALVRALAMSEIDVIELNEALAAQALAVMRGWAFPETDRERTNVHGSGISVGAAGGRMLASLARELRRRETRFGLEPMCIGGGQGIATVFERLA